ncbi:hypothetical protein I3J27_07720 [Bradyrhizobium xenonodulans]|uniref:Uncharacterized protein n=1 Tax=Bradyrhizobium xenonodulans TaxID=2736875 RepID=A0ABY7MPM9_9BRAD|nr:hypothetical protein [Bradyrhizobium xenonodulans]WBL80299.1 hypothetical protein I3J27_07720 [Bradyrhizobium xenonodulans]
MANAIGRSILVVIAIFSAGWAMLFFLSQTQESRLSNIANAVLSGTSFKRNPIAEAGLAAAENRAICNPREIRAAAIIRLRLYEMAVDSLDSQLANERLTSLRSSVRKALGCIPTDGLLWFIQYWSAINRGDQVSDHLDELRMSYRLAPYEGWIALRSPYVLAIYDVLPPELQESARREFVSIVRTGWIRDALKILKGAGWRHREALLAGLGTVRLDFRLQLDRALRAEGLTVQIPGIEPQEFRPWRY